MQVDDWFKEPVVPESRHDAYTRRLVAWGYLTPAGFTKWDQSSLGVLGDLLKTYYIPQLKADLSRTTYGNPWWLDPERMEP